MATDLRSHADKIGPHRGVVCLGVHLPLPDGQAMATTAPAMIQTPMSRPMALRKGADMPMSTSRRGAGASMSISRRGACLCVSTSLIRLVPQEEQPGGQRAQDDQTGVDQAPWPQVRMQVRRYKELTRNPSDHE